MIERNRILEPISDIDIPIVENCETNYQNEKLVSLSDLFVVDSQYYKQGIKGSLSDCFVRETVAKKLKQAESFLPNSYRFKIFDGYRPLEVQDTLWNMYKEIILQNNPNISNIELEQKVSIFVSKPSYDELQPSLHNTGGAIDLTLIDNNDNEINMGTKFDDFSPKSWSSYFEHNEDEEIKNNRRILYNAMKLAGFTNLPSEWWHYDYGDKYWSYFTNKPILYKGIIDYNNQIKALNGIS